MKEGEVDLKSITEEAKIENIAVITDFVNSILEANGCSAKVQMEIDIAIDEIFWQYCLLCFIRQKTRGNCTG